MTPLFNSMKHPAPAAITFICVVALCGFASNAMAQLRTALMFDDPRTHETLTENEQIAVVRSRPVTIDTHQLRPTRSGDRLVFNLFDDVTLIATVDQYRQSATQTFHWQGTIVNEPLSSVVLVLHKGVAAGSIHSPTMGDFRIRSAPGGQQVIDEVEQSLFPPCGIGPEQIEAGGVDGPKPPPRPRPDCGNTTPTTLDLMIVYTAQARDLEGGTTAIEALAIAAADATNFAFTNSEIAPRVNLVHIAEVDYVESGSFSTELARLRDTADGFMDDVHAWRDQYNADLVDLLVSHTQENTICGIAYLMTTVSTDFADRAFSVCNTGCTSGGYTLEHEIGHNMGCHHDRDNASGQGAFSFSYGYRFDAPDKNQYRTIMSYAPGNRIAYFSNPNLLYQTVPLGLPEGSVDETNQPNSADNARTINLTGSTVADFRSVAPITSLTGDDLPHAWPSPGIVLPDDLLAGDFFGSSVAISGNLMLVGSYRADNPIHGDTGAAYIFRRDPDAGLWMQEAKLVAPDAFANDRFGASVAILDDGVGGGWCAIGAYLTDDGGRDSGSVYIFRMLGGEWTFQQELLANDKAPGDVFGWSVAIASGPLTMDTVLVGAYLDDDGFNNNGSAYVFQFNGATFVQTAKLKAPDAAAMDQFGFSVSLAASPTDGHLLALIGSWRDDHSAVDAGSAYLFRNLGAGWVPVDRLVASDAELSDQFGYAVDVAFAARGPVVAVSAWRDDGPVPDTGAVYVYREAPDGLGGTFWMQEQKLIANDQGENVRFGSALSMDGSRLLIGAYLHDISGVTNSGAAYVFRYGSSGWVQEARIVPPDLDVEGQFGYAVSLSGDFAAIGAWQRDQPQEFGDPFVLAGAVYVTGSMPVIDCNKNGVADECDIFLGTSEDLNNNGVPDECDPHPCEQYSNPLAFTTDDPMIDCNGNGIPDKCDIYLGNSLDKNENGVPDECDPPPHPCEQLLTITEGPFIDCNRNGIWDKCDIYFGTSLDLNENGVPDECDEVDPPSDCPADVAPQPNGDGVVGVPDLLLIISNWGACAPAPAACPADIAPQPNGDGAVGVPDLLMLISNWGACPP